jgi:hypothetical protein
MFSEIKLTYSIYAQNSMMEKLISSDKFSYVGPMDRKRKVLGAGVGNIPITTP